MKMGVSEVARLFDIDRHLVKQWAFRFRDYLSADANPEKGTPRQLCTEDLRVLAYVFHHWEDDPDFQSIEAGLNWREHESEIYDDLVTSVLPMFDEPPDDLDETWQHVCVVGGICNAAFDTFTLADSYKLAGDSLVDAALSTAAESHELVYPIIYNYRHATELYLKAVLSSKKKNHDITPLLQKLRAILKTEFNATIPHWFEHVIMAFDDFDPDSTTFRYGELGVFSRRNGDSDEFCVSLPHVKQLMDWTAAAFQRIKRARAKGQLTNR